MMYSRKEILAEIKKHEVGSPAYGMLQDYFRLVTSWIPQVKEKLNTRDHGYFFPHHVSAKPCAHQDSNK